MFKLFRGNWKKGIEEIDEKIENPEKNYIEILKEDINLTIRTIHKGKTYTSYVEDLNDKEIIFRCPSDNDDLIRFREKSIIKAEFISYSELYVADILISEKIIKNNILYYKGTIKGRIEKKQRRKNYRLPIILEFNYTLLPQESNRYSGNTIDISVDGMLMETKENINKDKEIKVIISINEKNYEIESKIINKRTNYKNEKYLYNLKFKDLSAKHKNEIAAFISDNKIY